MTTQNKKQKIVEEFRKRFNDFGFTEEDAAYCEDAMSRSEGCWKLKHIEYFLTTALTTIEEEARKEAIIDCINVLPIRSDWDDDEKVTAQMVIDTAREALNSYLTNPNQ